MGRGGEGAVFEGTFHLKKAAFKLVKVAFEVKNGLMFPKTNEKTTDELLSIKGCNLLPFYAHAK